MRVRILRNPSRDLAKTIAAETDAFPTDGPDALREGQVREVDDKAGELLIGQNPPLAEATTDPVREVPTDAERFAMQAEDTEQRLRDFRARQAEGFRASNPVRGAGQKPAGPAAPTPTPGTHVDPKHPKKEA